MARENLNLLRTLWAEFSPAPFPPDSNDPMLSDIHTELVLLDADIAGLASCVAGQVPIDRYPDVEAVDSILQRLKSAGDSHPELCTEIREYIHYTTQLRALAVEVQRAARRK